MSLSNLYRSLCQEQQSRTGLSIRQVASTARLSPGTIDHFLAHGGTPSFDRLIAISDALKIDRLRAQVALEVIGCADSYYSPGTALMSRLIPRLTIAISRPDCELDEELNSWQTEAIISQTEQAICKGLETNNQIKQRFLSLGR
jgi:transcriptional regulator with XRE-family HTH domain